MSSLPPILITGPTAVGKSEVALILAERVGGEMVSVDSMQVYRGLDLGTAKPTEEERRRVPHHLIDVVDLSGAFDAARFAVMARAVMGEIQARGRRPILCGGTGLYFKALLEGLGEAPPGDPALRAVLEATPLEELLRELEGRDPAMFARIDRRNPRRVVRAVEVIRLTGRPFAEQRAGWEAAPRLPAGWVFAALTREPAELRRRIEERVDRMFARGLVAETQALLGRGLAGNPAAMQAIGYRQVVEHLRGERSLPETVALVKTRTWQFARRQMTWLRRQLPVTWVPAGEDPGAVAAAIQGLDQRAVSDSQ
ncbi:MAG: tRNA (N6-dimethylallyl-A37)-dimethylallyltransferase [Verrucomicrobiota bacterium]|jgi:tRNA dimethylallyltransferase